MAFSLKVTKYKCVECDLLFLVEKKKEYLWESPDFCPSCSMCLYTEKLGEVVIKEEEE